MISGVYAIKSPSGRSYIGSSSNVRSRWSGHKAALRRGNHHCRALQFAANKYGVDSFTFEILELCYPGALIELEQQYIDATPTRYNSAPVAGSIRGFKLSEETKLKMSLAERGKVRSPETRKRMSEYARNRDPAHLARLSVAQAGKTASPETRAKQRASKLGTRQTKEHVANARRALLGKPTSATKHGVKGVSLDRGRWTVRITVNGKYKNLGRFPTWEAATEVALSARKVTEPGEMPL